jgi:hypothetical protein
MGQRGLKRPAPPIARAPRRLRAIDFEEKFLSPPWVSAW